MHISEGILSGSVLAAGSVMTATGVVIGIRKMDYEEVPKIAVMSSAFFVASLIHVPVGPSNVHMILNGLAGVILGWAVFPALLVALLLHALLFQFGGLTTLGVNTINMALPALICHFLFKHPIRYTSQRTVLFVSGFAAGALAIVLSSGLMALSLYTTGKEFMVVITMVLASHVPVVLLEGLITATIIVFLRKVRPEILGSDMRISP